VPTLLAALVTERKRTFSVGLDPDAEQTAAEWFEALGYRTLTGDTHYIKAGGQPAPASTPSTTTSGFPNLSCPIALFRQLSDDLRMKLKNKTHDVKRRAKRECTVRLAAHYCEGFWGGTVTEKDSRMAVSFCTSTSDVSLLSGYDFANWLPVGL
jgi:hypothetical protein